MKSFKVLASVTVVVIGSLVALSLLIPVALAMCLISKRS